MDNESNALRRNLGENLMQLREKRGLTQALLARHATVPRSTIAHMESGDGNPSLTNLAKIASALRISLEELVRAPGVDVRLTRAKDVVVSERAHGAVCVAELLGENVPGLQMERMEFRPKGFLRGTPHVDGTKEYLTCVAGTIRVTVAGHDWTLSPGDVLAFPGSRPHAYHNPGRVRAVGISVVALV